MITKQDVIWIFYFIQLSVITMSKYLQSKRILTLHHKTIKSVLISFFQIQIQRNIFMNNTMYIFGIFVLQNFVRAFIKRVY